VPSLDVRPLATRAEYERVVAYFHDADDGYLRGMAVDRAKLPPRDAWLDRMVADAARPDRERELCHVGWYVDDVAVGHSNINKIVYGVEAYIHLHLWRADLRRAGAGSELFRRTATYFRTRFALARIYCEPWADNPAPNRVLAKLGARFVERYRTTPGPINLEQEVNRWVIE
jgi:RimJ/RimL family protein N-acetyltransferase